MTRRDDTYKIRESFPSKSKRVIIDGVYHVRTEEGMCSLSIEFGLGCQDFGQISHSSRDVRKYEVYGADDRPLERILSLAES